MPVSVPPKEALAEFLGATTRHVRRIEIYEADGTTRWAKDTVGRLKDGTTTVDYSRDERRALDLTLSNDDGVLINAPGEFWYDKIIKVYRGVQVNQAKRLPKILIASDSTTTPWGPDLRAAFAAIGFGDVQINVLASSYAIDLAPFDIIIALGAQGKGALLKSAYDAGKSVFVFREGAQEFYDAILLGAAWTGLTADVSDRKERRRNYLVDPSALNGATDWFTNAPTGVAARSVPTTAGAQGNNFVRATWTTASTSVGGGIYVSTVDIVDSTGVAAAGGKTFTASMWVRSSIAQTITPRIEWKGLGGGAILSTATGTAVALVANTWTRISITAVAPANTGRLTMTSYASGTGAVVWPINSTLDGDGGLVEQSAALGDYFDGATTSTETQTYAWTGAANASMSTVTSGYTETRRNLAPIGGATVPSAGAWLWYPWPGTGGAGTQSTVTAAWAASGKAQRGTWTTGVTAASGDIGLVITNGLLPNTQYTASITVVSSKAQRLMPQVANPTITGGAAGSGTVTTQSNTPTTVVTAGAATTFTITFTTGANTTGLKVLVTAVSGTGYSAWVAGDWLDGSNGIVELGAVGGAFFDGATTDADPYNYEWVGTAFASPAVQRQIILGSISPNPVNDPRTVGWKTFPVTGTSNATYKAPTAATSSSIFPVAYAPGRTDAYAISAGSNAVGGKFMAIHYPLTSAQYVDSLFRQMLWVAVTWLNPVVLLKTWEIQIGEFMIDRINEEDFPFEMKITGRDYTKKCMMSKYNQATQFDAGQTLEGLIGVIATAAGITKKLLPATGIIVGQSFFFERNTSRWDAMKKIATAYNYEIFFDATGYLVIRPFRDPTTSAPVVWINTGIDGQVATYAKSTSDASLFNHILVAGESSDQSTPPVWAEAKNTDPNSKTSIAAIGDRYWEYTSPLITTTAQAQALADSFLAIHSLEEFELQFETLLLPWLEAGDILGWIDPRPNPGDPRTFLLSSLTIPLGLSPMSGTGKRLLIVGF